MPGYARHTETGELVAIIEEVDSDGNSQTVMVKKNGTRGLFPGAWRMVIAEDVRSASAAQKEALKDVPEKKIHGSAKDPKLAELRKAERRGLLMRAEPKKTEKPGNVHSDSARIRDKL